LVVPLLTCLTAAFTYRVGQRLFSTRISSLCLLLLTLSPQFVFMGATDLSQPTAALFIMAGLWCLLRCGDDKRRLFCLLSGAAIGFLLLVRPFPGLLVLPVVGTALLAAPVYRTVQERLWMSVCFGIPIAAALIALLLINKYLTGDAAQASYHVAHAAGKRGFSGLGLFTVGNGIMSTSVFGALLRLNFWLLGWPISFVLLLGATVRRNTGILWALLAAVWAYRFVVPKTVVATLGPVYVTEAIPILLLLCADGIFRLPHRISNIVQQPARSVAAVVIASVAIGLCCFLPIPIRDVGESANLRVSVVDHIR
jgi:4-amino-4-deoxy-L-arabinose transferase-like glycosyltransferase